MTQLALNLGRISGLYFRYMAIAIGAALAVFAVRQAYVAIELLQAEIVLANPVLIVTVGDIPLLSLAVALFLFSAVLYRGRERETQYHLVLRKDEHEVWPRVKTLSPIVPAVPGALAVLAFSLGDRLSFHLFPFAVLALAAFEIYFGLRSSRHIHQLGSRYSRELREKRSLEREEQLAAMEEAHRVKWSKRAPRPTGTLD
jgi:hypothetical protein